MISESDGVDRSAPWVEGIIGGERQIDLEGDDVSLTLEIAISESGGSGFLEGIIWLPGSAAGDYGADFAGMVFGPENRIRGDGEVGIYRVELSEGRVGFAENVITASALLSHAVGVSGGLVVLLDELGGVVEARAFGAAERVDGSATRGRYEVSFPLPQVGTGGETLGRLDLDGVGWIVADFTKCGGIGTAGSESR